MRFLTLLFIAGAFCFAVLLGTTAMGAPKLSKVSTVSVRVKSVPARRSGGGFYIGGGSSRGSRYSSGGGSSFGK